MVALCKETGATCPAVVGRRSSVVADSVRTYDVAYSRLDSTIVQVLPFSLPFPREHTSLWSGLAQSRTRRASMGRWIGRLIAALVGWKVVMAQFPPTRCVVIGAPHTSAWDMPLTMLLMLATGVRMRWVAKESLFRGPLGWLLSNLGALPVDRSGQKGFVAAMSARFAASEQLIIGILPEGTRSKADYWKTGFYYLAISAEVPIMLAYADYRRREIGFGPVLRPSGDIHADFQIIRAFYTGVTGLHPEQQGPIRLAE
jgi:1-acyl-sn-glycerol-3-phosphate acyltransferase